MKRPTTFSLISSNLLPIGIPINKPRLAHYWNFLLATIGCQVTTHGVQDGMIFEEIGHVFVHTGHCDQFANESLTQ